MFFASDKVNVRRKNVKRIELLILVLVLALAGCQSPQNQEQIGADETDRMADGSAAAPIEAETTENNFRLKLYADQSVYSTNEIIKIWAALEYIGDENSVTIWHGDPYIVFSITDGADFYVDGFINCVLISTELEKGEQYRFDYGKSGVYDPKAPDAGFWRKFFQEEELKLPAGTYTISVDGAFYLSEQLLPAEKGPSCELQITVQ